jgi:hypothetical protein
VEAVVGGGDGEERRGRTVPVGEKMGLGKKKGERKGFSAAVTVGRGDHGAGFGGRKIWVPVEGERGWRENGFGGKFLEGGK